MKPAFTPLIAFLLFVSIKVYSSRTDIRSEGSSVPSGYTTFTGVDLIVRFDTTFSDSYFSEIQDDFEGLGLFLFSSLDMQSNVAGFRPITFHSDSSIIQEIYQIAHVDTVYYPLMDENSGYIYYYDDRKVKLGFYDDTPDTVREKIITEHNCTILFEYSSIAYDLSIHGDQDLFSLMDDFSALPQVKWVGLYNVGSGGVYTTDYIESYYWDDLQFSYESGRIHFHITWGVPSSPCHKVSELRLGDNSTTDYYGLFFAGPQDRVCDLDDALSFEIADTANFLLTLHQFIQSEYGDFRIIISRGSVASLVDPGNKPSDTDLLRYYISDEQLSVWYTGEDKVIKMLEISSINGIKKESRMDNIDGREPSEINISGFPKGIYVGYVLFSDGTTGSFKFLKN